jgi:predicted membrane-bound dolichyl-phosphate-mannose-protein mannosyltransferase
VDYSIAKNVEPFQIRLYWEAPYSENGSPIISYRVWFFHIDTFRLVKTNVVAALSPEITFTSEITLVKDDQVIKFIRGQTYTFQVQAYSAVGWGERSDPLDVIPGAQPNCGTVKLNAGYD